MSGGVDRREFLTILGVGGGTAALVGCAVEKPETLIPYLIPPEEVIPGRAVWYATTCRECPAGCGMLVRTREGRAVKAEGNPRHPVNAGRLCARGQASLQGLYNPDRIRQPLRKDETGVFRSLTWEEGEKLLAGRVADLRRQGKGRGIVCVTPAVTGSLASLTDQWLSALGARPRLAYETFAYESVRAASRLTFGEGTIPTYDIAAAEMLLSFGADFLETWISPVAFARDFAALRRYQKGTMGRFIYVGPRLSLTAANADEWVSLPPGAEAVLALGLTHVILRERLAAPLPPVEAEALRALVKTYDLQTVAARTGVPAETILRLARTFAAAKPSLALGGCSTAGSVAVTLLNYVAGNVGKTLRFGPRSSFDSVATYRDIRRLIERMEKGDVEVLLLSGVNPLFTLPEGAGFRAALKKVPLVVSVSSAMDETASEAHLILPDHTFLESWGEYSPREGVDGVTQPAMRPIWETKGFGDVLLSVARQVDGEVARKFPWPTFYEYLREQWKKSHQRWAPTADFDDFWEGALRQGGVWKAVRPRSVRLSPRLLRFSFEETRPEKGAAQAFSLHLYPSLAHFDGRGANRPWLQELPDPMTQIVWDGWIEIHPETARRLGVTEGEIVRVISRYGAIEFPAHLSPGIRPDVVAVPIGQGHTTFGQYAKGRGANPLSLLSPEPESTSGGLAWSSTRVTLTRTGRKHPLVSVGGSKDQEGRGIAQAIPLAALGKEGAEREERAVPQIYPPHAHPEHRWGMAIDLHACIGCSACVVACYAENNLPVVGKERVAEGRIMSWIRIERYVEREEDHLDTRFLPMLCQQCDNAPCESVCPVYATYHTREGLNAQVYNRCVGVRYCSNNCPYKVRRFNWFQYDWPEPLHMQLNPDVSVRTVGIMEKCTFCVQRIQEGKERAKDEGRSIRDGEIVPACAQTCPTQAIVFGDLKDPNSQVSKLSRSPRRYRVLEHLNTQPAITYLKKVKHE